MVVPGGGGAVSYERGTFLSKEAWKDLNPAVRHRHDAGVWKSQLLGFPVQIRQLVTEIRGSTRWGSGVETPGAGWQARAQCRCLAR